MLEKFSRRCWQCKSCCQWRSVGGCWWWWWWCWHRTQCQPHLRKWFDRYGLSKDNQQPAEIDFSPGILAQSVGGGGGAGGSSSTLSAAAVERWCDRQLCHRWQRGSGGDSGAVTVQVNLDDSDMI